MKYLKVIIVNLLLLFFLLSVIEYLLEQRDTEASFQFVRSRYVKLREFALPGESGDISVSPSMQKVAEGLEFKKYKITIDSLGFIQSEKLLNEPKTKIVFFGGSTTECRFVDDSLRFPGLVGTKFQQAGLAVNTYNAGFSGNNTQHSINSLIHKVIHRDFQVAVLMHNINDLTWLSHNRFYHEEKYPNNGITYATMVAPEVDDHDLSYFEKTGLFFRTKKATQLVFPQLYNQFHNIKLKLSPQISLQIEYYPPFRSVGERQFHQFEQNLKTFIAICRVNGIQPVLMTQFNRIREDILTGNPVFNLFIERLKEGGTTVPEFCGYYRHMNDITRKVAAEEKVLLIDLEKAVLKDKQYLYDIVHLNGEGSKLVAGIIYQELSKNLFPPAN